MAFVERMRAKAAKIHPPFNFWEDMGAVNSGGVRIRQSSVGGCFTRWFPDTAILRRAYALSPPFKKEAFGSGEPQWVSAFGQRTRAHRPKGSLLEGAAAARRLRELETRLPRSFRLVSGKPTQTPSGSGSRRCWNTAIPRQRLRAATPFQKGGVWEW